MCYLIVLYFWSRLQQMELCPFLRVHCFGPCISTLGSSISTLQVPLQCLSCSDEESEWMQVQVPWASSSYVAHSSRHLDQWTLISVLWYSFSYFAYESWLQKQCGALLATMGDRQTARKKSRKHNHESVALRLLIMGIIHPCMIIFLQGGIGECLAKCLLCIYLVSVYQVGCVFARHPWQMVSPWKYIC